MNSKRTARNQQIADLILAALIAVITIIMIFVPNMGFIVIGPVAITTVHIPVLVGAVILGRKYGTILGAIFGIGSMIQAFLLLTTHAPFTNPLVSVVPRILFGLLTAVIYSVLHRAIKNKYVAIPITMGLGTLIHSILVLPILYVVIKSNFYFFPDESIFAINQNIFSFIYGIFVANSVLEIVLGIIVGTAVTIPLLILKENNK